MSLDRKDVLLRACYDMLAKLDRMYYVQSPFETTVYYDEADCDGSCLMEDIENELGIDRREYVLAEDRKGAKA